MYGKIGRKFIEFHGISFLIQIQIQTCAKFSEFRQKFDVNVRDFHAVKIEEYFKCSDRNNASQRRAEIRKLHSWLRRWMHQHRVRPLVNVGLDADNEDRKDVLRERLRRLAKPALHVSLRLFENLLSVFSFARAF